MNINLAPRDEQFVESKVQEGYYKSKTDVIEDAVRRMREADEQRGGAVYAAIMKAEEDVTAGRVKAYTPEVEAQIRQEGRARAKAGRKPKVDVTD